MNDSSAVKDCSMPKTTRKFRKDLPQPPAETAALRRQVRRLLAENQKLKTQLSKPRNPTNSVQDDDAKSVLVVIEKHGEILVREIARRLRLHPTEVERLLEDLEFEGRVRSRQSLRGTHYRLTPAGRKFLQQKQ
jgi:DNA-binding MarR family transcriptional regulator